MFKKFALFTVLLLLAGRFAWAFESDTVKLKEVVIYGIPQQKFATGSKIVQFDSIGLASQQSRSLSELLMQKSSIYFKQYGPGMLSTISFRGTSPNHTAVLWNGLNLNQPNLGQTDFSLIPLFVVEDIAVQYGGGSALYGSDAIGGTIYLQSKPQWRNALAVQLQQEVGSFGRLFTGLGAQAGFHNWSVRSKVYKSEVENDFEYINTNKRDRPVQENRNARFEQKGLVQDVAYRFSNSSDLSFKSWYQQTYRQLQPTMGDFNSNDQQDDKNLNLSLQCRHNSKVGFFDLQAGHLYNYLQYNKGNTYETWQYIGNVRYEKSLGNLVQLQLGAKHNYIEAAIAQYPNEFANENRTDFFSSFRIRPDNKLVASLNLRQAFVTGYRVPFTPSAGLEYTFLHTQLSKLQILTSGGRSFRVPTFNDRYWQYTGNPNLKPEDSWNLETTVQYAHGDQKKNYKLSATAYNMWIDNWILWLPGTVAGPDGKPMSSWTPQNVQEVLSRGFELSGNIQHPLAEGSLEAGSNIAYTRSVNRKAKHEYDRTVDHQLPFIPIWKGTAFVNYRIGSWSFGSNYSYTGTRYTTGEESEDFSIAPFGLVDVSLGKSFYLKEHTFNLTFETRNLFNKQYQNYESRAMPGRNFNLTIKYLFNHNL